MENLKPGLVYEFSRMVEDKDLASNVGSGIVSVFSTAMMVAGMEEAAVACVQSQFPEGYTTVGTHLDISHKASTPLGMAVKFRAVLTAISPNGKGLTFDVQAWDEVGEIGEGKHMRVIVEQKGFEEKTRNKRRS